MNKGFIALTLVITTASLLLAFTYMQSIEIALFFDQTRLKEYRLINYYNAGSCIDQAILNLAHDYFYEVSTPIIIPDFNCVIDSVESIGEFRIIHTYGNYKNIKIKRMAKVKLYDDRVMVELLI